MPYGLPPKKNTPENNRKIERCVAEVMAGGEDKSSAIAICKSRILGEDMSENLTVDGKRAVGFYELDVSIIDADSRSRIEVFPGVGKYKHPDGKFEITQKHLEEFVADINARGDKIPFDFDHSFAKGGGSQAAGWYVPGSAEIVDGKVMADVEWTSDGEAAVRAKTYRFISPEFALKYKDTAGKIIDKARLEATALTNRPFFDTMAPVTICDKGLGQLIAERDDPRLLDADDVELLSRVLDEPTRELMTASLQSIDAKTREQTRTYLMSLDEPSKKEEPEMSELTEMLGLAADATPEAILTAVKTLREEEKRVEAEQAEIAAMLKARNSNGKEHDMDLTLIAAELGLSKDSDDATVIAALRKARGAIERSELDGEELDRLRADSAAKGKLEERVKVIEAERRNDKVKSMLAEGVRLGKVMPSEKPTLFKLFAMNPDGLFELLQARPEHVFRMTAIGADGGDSGLDESLYGVAKEFESKEADGGIDPESAKLHLQAQHILAEQGKRNPTEDEYFQALQIATENG